MAVPLAPLDLLDDQNYYPLHEEDDVPETPPHERRSRYARDAIETRFPHWFVTGNVCIYWERGNTQKYRAPDLFVVKEPLTEPVTRVYQLWRQPPVAFVLEVANRSTFRQDEEPKLEIYQEQVKAAEYLHVDLDRKQKRLWRLGPGGYVSVAEEPNGRLRSEELGLEFDLEDGTLQIYTPEGERLLSHEELEAQRAEEARGRQEAERQRAVEAQLRQEAEAQRLEEARRRQEAEAQQAEEARRRQEAEARATELERQLAELRARLGDE
jgi:Uma2 family endonuclease